jgi:hypothetical protein
MHASLDRIPHLIAEPEPDSSEMTGWRVWCAFCTRFANRNSARRIAGTFHHHSPGPGHRCAHCNPHDGSPYLATGYVLVSREDAR